MKPDSYRIRPLKDIASRVEFRGLLFIIGMVLWALPVLALAKPKCPRTAFLFLYGGWAILIAGLILTARLTPPPSEDADGES